MAATNKRGIFTLQDVKVRQGSGNWPIEAFTKPPYSLDWQFGYAIGGSDRSVILSSVDRVDYSNDNAMASVRGFLAAARGYGTSVSSRDYGYSAGGRGPAFPSLTTDTQRIDYSNDTATAVPKGNLTEPWRGGQAVDNITYGYLLGGMGPGTNHTLTNRIDFSNDTNQATPVGNMDVDRYAGAGCGNENYGYAGTGLINSQTQNSSSISRIDYSTDTTQLSPKGPLSTEKRTTLSSSNENFGYWSGYSPETRVDKYDFANDTTTIVADLPNSQFYSGATGNASFGYYMAGYRVAPSMQTTVNRLDYSNDTASMSVRGPLTFEKLAFKSVSGKSNVKPQTRLTIPDQGVGITTTGATNNFENQTVFSYPYGYKSGGYNTSTSRTDRIDFSNDCVNALHRSSLTQGDQWAMGSASSPNHGYVMGGTDPFTSQIERLDYSNDTQNTTAAGFLSEAGYYGGATGNKDYAWYAFGIGTPTYKTDKCRFDYSNDSATSLTRGFTGLPARGWWQGMGNQNYGFFGGGYPAPSDSRIERIDYSNDTSTTTQYGSMSLNGKHMYAAASNADYGWFMGGNSSGSRSSVERLDFSNGNSTVSPRGFLPRNTAYCTGTGSQSYGYTFGGLAPATSSYINRIDYSNDTATALDRGVLTQTVSGYGAGANSSQACANPQTILKINDLKATLPVVTPGQQYGYVAGGDYGPDVSTIERIDYANDTPGTSVRTSLPTATYGASFVGNAYYGYYGGGFTPGPTVRSTVERVDFYNDTVVGPVGPLSLARGFFGPQAAGNQNYGWFAGGYSATDRVDRIDYANDLNTASPRTSITAARYGMAAVGNLNYGYWCGGNPGPVSYIERITYADDTVTQITGLSQGRRYAAATGNTNYGWIGGGNLPSPITSYSIVDRIDYSNDTAVASVRGPLSQQRYQLTATGNKDYGYWFGGFYPASYSTVDRVDFANDTVTATRRGFITQARYDLVAASAAANGLPQG